MADMISNTPWPRAIGLAALSAGFFPMLLIAEDSPVWVLAGICVPLMFLGSALLCGAWEFWEVQRREARSRSFDGEAYGTIVASKIGPASADTSPLMDLTVSFTDQGNTKHRAFVRKVVAQNALHQYAVGQSVIVRYATATPATDLTIAPLV